MSDRGNWLELTTEPALEPELPICDPHHHLWDYPGSRYLAEEFLNDLAQDSSNSHRVVSSVFVECQQFYDSDLPEHLRPVGETRFVDRLAEDIRGAATDVAAGIVAFADLNLGAAVAEVLDAHLAASRRVRGIRHASAWHPSDRIHNAHTQPPEGLLAQSQFREGFACLEPLGLSFDAWLYHDQIPELVDLAVEFPGVNIVLNHMAGPLGIGPYSGEKERVFAEWHAQLVPLASCANMYVKLGGRTMSNAGFAWHKQKKPPGSVELADTMAPYFDACIALFGPERCMFESNFPVDRASCSYTVLWNAFKRASASYSAAERAALFHDTAARFYRLA